MPNNYSIEFKLQEVTIMADNKWRCRAGKEAPEVCPVCNHPRDYFQLKSENY